MNVIKFFRSLILFAVVVAIPAVFAADAGEAPAKKVKYSKTQEVNFDQADIDGQVRSPDGAYLLQKRGVNFIPLYKVDREFERGVGESIEYLR